MTCRTVAVFVFGSAAVFGQLSGIIGIPQSGATWQTDIANAYQAMSKGDYAQSDSLMDQALAAALKAGPYASMFVPTVQQVGAYYADSGLDLKGESVFKTALELARRDQAFPVAAQTAAALANRYMIQGREIKALALFRQTIAEIEARSGVDAAELCPVLVQAALAAERAGNLSEAEAWLIRAAAIKPADPRQGTATGAIYVVRTFAMPSYNQANFSLASFYLQHRRFAEAETIYTSATEQAKTTQEQVMALQMYSGMLRQRKRYAEAEAAQKRIIELRENSSTPGERQAARWDRQNLAHLYLESGNYEAANKLIEEQVQRAQSAANANEYFQALMTKADALLRQNKAAEADTVADQMLQSASDKEPYQKQWALNKKAEIADKAGDRKAAETFRQAAANSVTSQPPGDANAIWSLFMQAQREVNAGRVDEGLALAGQAFSTAEASSNPGALCNDIYQVANIAHALLNQKKEDAADRLVQRGLDAAQQSCTRQNRIAWQDAAVSYYIARGFLDEAKRTVGQWEEAITALKGPDSTMFDWALRKRIEIARAENNGAQAAAFEEELLKRSETNHGPDSQETVYQRMNIARLAAMRNDFPRAEELWGKTLPVVERLWGGTAMHASALGEIADFYAQQKRFDEARQYARRALEIARDSDGQPRLFEDKLANIERLAAEKPAPEQEQHGSAPRRDVRWFNTTVFQR